MLTEDPDVRLRGEHGRIEGGARVVNASPSDVPDYCEGRWTYSGECAPDDAVGTCTYEGGPGPNVHTDYAPAFTEETAQTECETVVMGTRAWATSSRSNGSAWRRDDPSEARDLRGMSLLHGEDPHPHAQELLPHHGAAPHRGQAWGAMVTSSRVR